MFHHFDLPTFVNAIGYIGLFLLVFTESGLFFGFFLPGDSLLFTAGILAASGHFLIVPIILVVLAGAILGDSVGYYFGAKAGPFLFKRNDSRFFKKAHLERSAAFYEKHGSKTILLARFVPIVRTFAPIVAGASLMEYRRFLLWNAIGGVLWTLLLTLLGYGLGNSIPNVDRYLLPIIALVVVISFLPVLWNMYQQNKKAQ